MVGTVVLNLSGYGPTPYDIGILIESLTNGFGPISEVVLHIIRKNDDNIQ
jgi:hypothetical protein